MTYRDLTVFELEALQMFADAHKRKADRTRGCADWRDELSMVYWYNARIWGAHTPGLEGMGAALHVLRNDLGPSWLYGFKLP